MIFRSIFKKLSVSLLLVSLVLTVFGCSSKDSEFPSIEPPITSVSNSIVEETETDSVTENYKLTVALPYSEETVNYLFKLYYAKLNGMLSDDETGSSISLDFLDSISTPYSIEVIYVPDKGTSASSISSFGDSAPDIFLTNELDVCVSNGLCRSLNDYCSVNPLFDADNVYYDPMMACVYSENLYAVPHYLSIPLIYGNSDFVSESDRSDFKISLNDLHRIITNTHDANGEEVVCINSAVSLIPYISSAFDENSANASYMLYELYNSNPELAEACFDDTYEFVLDLYQNGYSLDKNDDGSLPVISRNAALWIADSSEISYYSEYYPNRLFIMQMPSELDANTTIPYVSVYPLCVSKYSLVPQLAADFASFISLDSDAILLLNRLEGKSGFLPVVSNSVVWDAYISNEVFGYVASVYETEMGNSVCSFDVINSHLNSEIINVISSADFNDSEEINIDLVDIYGE